ncbi:hypothetical protein AB4Z48_06130 [Cupriavidus sp. 2TAF22]|uniref:hypothetical protein n=1 Tax=unclassified Cupriavidus TaxID=2640874 RepID=UPI003F8E3C49
MSTITTIARCATVAVALLNAAAVQAAGWSNAGARDPFTSGARSVTGVADPYSDGARSPYTDGARVGRFDPYTDGART